MGKHGNITQLDVVIQEMIDTILLQTMPLKKKDHLDKKH